jgi:hypothetical protein
MNFFKAASSSSLCCVNGLSISLHSFLKITLSGDIEEESIFSEGKLCLIILDNTS